MLLDKSDNNQSSSFIEVSNVNNEIDFAYYNYIRPTKYFPRRSTNELNEEVWLWQFNVRR